MRVGILTYHDALSYGARLQALALQECIRSLGHEVSIIDYRGNVHTAMHWYDIFRTRSPWGFVNKYNKYRMDCAFRGFNGKYYHLTKSCTTETELQGVAAEFDALVVGSDQVWQLRNFSDESRFDPNYFLSFVKTGVRRISYAASFGHEFPRTRIAEEIEDLKKFDSLSVREGRAADELARCLNREVVNVCDPTLLWGRNGSDSILPYERCTNTDSFYFSLSPQEDRDARIITATRRLFRKNVVLASRALRMSALGANFTGGPISWIESIRTARFVLTNSFHGTVFSILYHRPFLFLPWERQSQNVRVFELLKKLNLTNHILSTGKDVRQQLLSVDSDTDWAKVDVILDEWRCNSRSYLMSALS